MISRLILSTVVIMGLHVEVATADTINVIGLGDQSCWRWTAERRTPGTVFEYGLMQWIVAFIAGMAEGMHSVGHPVPFNPLHGVDADGVWAWTDNYCAAHPLEPLRDVAFAFAEARYPGKSWSINRTPLRAQGWRLVQSHSAA
jgi:hypothetical protein